MAIKETTRMIQSITTSEYQQAIIDLDNEKYLSGQFTTQEYGKKYNFLSHKGRYYNPKRIVECALLNKGYVVNYNEFVSSATIRNRIKRTGHKMVTE